MQIDMDLKLSDREWKQFKLASIFKIENCKCSKVSGLQNGTTPYVGATNRNNGVMSFVKADKKLITKGNCLAFICDGEGSVGYSIYKSEDFIGSTTVKVGRNENLNKYNATFITTIADKVRSKYNFGFKRNETHLKNEILMLPANKKGEPDFEFMEAFMKQKEQEKFQEYNDYISQRIKDLKDFKTVELIEEKEWDVFELGNLFNIYTGGDLIISKIQKGHIAVISHSIENNGIAIYSKEIENRKLFDYKNTLSLADRGNFYAFTQLQNFYIGTRVKALEAKFRTNPFILKYLSATINKQSIRFSYGNNATSGTDKIRIMLPINNQNEPDYDYMENYMKQLEYNKLNEYLRKKEKLNANA